MSLRVLCLSHVFSYVLCFEAYCNIFFRFLVREFVYDEQALEAGKNEITKLESDKKKQFVSQDKSPLLIIIFDILYCELVGLSNSKHISQSPRCRKRIQGTCKLPRLAAQSAGKVTNDWLILFLNLIGGVDDSFSLIGSATLHVI